MAANNNERFAAIESRLDQVAAAILSVTGLIEKMQAPVQAPTQQRQAVRSQLDMTDAELQATYGPWRISVEEFLDFKASVSPSKKNLAVAKLLAMNLHRVTTYAEAELYMKWKHETAPEDVVAWWKGFGREGVPQGL